MSGRMRCRCRYAAVMKSSAAVKKYVNEADKKISSESAYGEHLDLLTEHN